MDDELIVRHLLMQVLKSAGYEIVGEAGAHVQFGGGLRTMADIEAAINTGVKKIVLGTIAIEDPSVLTEILRRIGPDGVIVALDALQGQITTKGWTKITERPVLEAAREMEATGVREILYTDISRDGMTQLGVEIAFDFDEILPRCDVVNLLRIQFERQRTGLFPSIREYARLFGMDGDRMRKAKPDLLILAPGPINRGVEVTPEVADGSHSVILEQVSNGLAVRMAVLKLLCGVG